MKSINIFYSFLVCFLLTIGNTFAQDCGTILTQEKLPAFEAMEDRIRYRTYSMDMQASGTSYSFPIKLYLISKSDGSNAPDMNVLVDDIIQMNELFSGAAIQFHVCRYVSIKSDKFYDLNLNSEETNLLDTYYDKDVINVYIVGKLTKDGDSKCGVGSFPSMENQRIILDKDCLGNGTTLAHEFGHYFNLLHTHEEAKGKDWVGNTLTCESVGDLCCDTDPDPGLSYLVTDPNGDCDCKYVGIVTDCNKNEYTPPVYNLMSYNGHKECRTELTSDQNGRIFEAAWERYDEVSECEAADLIVAQIETNTNVILAGDEIEVDLTLENIGDVVNVSGKVALYLSKNRPLDNETVRADKFYTRITPGTDKTVTAALTIPASYNGSYYIYAEVDYEHKTPEYDESNNTKYKKIYIGKPDIVTKSETVIGKDGEVIVSGGQIEVTSKAYNDGYGYAARSRMHYYLSTNETLGSNDEYLGFSLVDELEPSPLNGIFNKEVKSTLRLPSDVASFKKVGSSKGVLQDYYILFVSDANDNIDETDESNNVGSAKIFINAATDLKVTELELSNDRIPRFTDLTIDYTVKNIGTEMASRWTKIKFYLSENRFYDSGDTYLDEARIKALESEEEVSGNLVISRLMTRTWAFGDQYILAIIDPGELVEEGNEDNNVARHELEVYLPITTGTSSMMGGGNSMQLLPNPADDEVLIRSSQEVGGMTVLRILDMSGKVILDKDLGYRAVGEYADHVDINRLNSGLYIVNIDTDGHSISKRLSIIR